jgi:hypothetical protein
MPTDGSRTGVSRRRALLVGTAAATSVLSVHGLPAAGDDGTDAAGTPPAADSLARVRNAGVTGDGVRVAVVDPTGFDPTQAAIAGRIDDIRQFGDERAVVDGTTHGTAAAAAVATLAPDARLVLASFGTAGEFRAAVAWADAAGADVVLAPVAAHGTVATPRSTVARAARDAVESGRVVVAPTGNAALGHWEGPYAALAGNGPGDRRRLRVRPMPGSGSVAGRFRAWLVADPSAETDLTLALLRAVDGGDRWDLIAVSRPTAARLGRRVTASLDAGDYALVVRPAGRGDAGAPADPTTRVAVTTTSHAFADSRPAGSVAAPASVPGVVGVGAVRTDADTASATAPGHTDRPGDGSPHRIARYSGRGPTLRGDVGVDLVAPPRPWAAAGTPGTSAAAARTAGVAALVLGAAPSLGPADVRAVLRRSAGDLGDPGRDLSSGWGVLDGVAAVQRARSR